jgi:hypothetical protein
VRFQLSTNLSFVARSVDENERQEGKQRFVCGCGLCRGFGVDRSGRIYSWRPALPTTASVLIIPAFTLKKPDCGHGKLPVCCRHVRDGESALSSQDVVARFHNLVACLVAAPRCERRVLHQRRCALPFHALDVHFFPARGVLNWNLIYPVLQRLEDSLGCCHRPSSVHVGDDHRLAPGTATRVSAEFTAVARGYPGPSAINHDQGNSSKSAEPTA